MVAILARRCGILAVARTLVPEVAGNVRREKSILIPRFNKKYSNSEKA